MKSNDVFGVNLDVDENLRRLLKHAVQGHAKAQNNLANCFAIGTGHNKDEVQAVNWYRKAADQGYASAIYNFANCYMNGIGIIIDVIRAVDFLSKCS